MGIAEDRHAVAVCKLEDEVVGHVPKTISYMCSSSVRQGSLINCIVETARQYSSDLHQEGMEIPCKFIFRGMVDELQNATKYFRNALGMDVCICNTNHNSIVIAAHAVHKLVPTMDVSIGINMVALTPPVKCSLDSYEELPTGKHVNCIDISSSPLKHDTANAVKICVQIQ